MTDYRLPDFNAIDDESFRRLVRDFLKEHFPEELRETPKRLHWSEVKGWYMTLSRHGWLAPGWPAEFGGMGLSASKQLIYTEEFENYGVARTPDHGIMLLGPLLIRYGSPEQQQYFLPRILEGKDIWCQGYSEPNSGSDLASVRTEAVLDGDEWVINGQKIWTTLATDADWIFMLVRTDKSAKKQAGISFLLVPMDIPGVTVRPILNLDLHDELCEVFFDNVRVPKANLVGEMNAGWTMAKALLGFERIFLGSPKQSANALTRLSLLAEHLGIAEDPIFIDTFTRLRLDLEDHKLLFGVFAERLRRGETLGADVSLLKVHQTELFKRITDYMLEISGEYSGLLEPIEGNRNFNASGLFMQARPATIYGGSSEIQRNILAKTVLGLPS
jgi:hypothetical protein